MIINAKTYNTNPVTVRYSVKDYLDELHNRYGEYRKEWETLSALRKTEDERWQSEIRRGWNDAKIRMQDQQKHNEKLRNIKNKFLELSANAQACFNDVITEADTRFERYNRATGDKVDLATVELLKTDVLSSGEIKALSGDFEGNIAMLRIIGKYAGERAKTTDNSNESRELSALAIECKNAQFNYREPLEQYVFMATEALSSDDTKSFAYHKVLTEETYPQYNKIVENMYISEDYNGGDNSEQ